MSEPGLDWLDWREVGGGWGGQEVGVRTLFAASEHVISKTDRGSHRLLRPGPDTSMLSLQLCSMVSGVVDLPRVLRHKFYLLVGGMPEIVAILNILWPRSVEAYCGPGAPPKTPRCFTPLKPQRSLGGRCHHIPILQVRK